MNKPKENDILETSLSMAEKGYPEAYRFWLNAYEESPDSFGPQTFYFPAQMDGCPTLGQIAGNSPSVLGHLRQLKQNNSPTMTGNHAEYTVIKLLGKGKGGYSYLVTDGTAQYVLKQIHHEPCAYYTFGDKLQSELRDYETLRDLGIPMPRRMCRRG